MRVMPILLPVLFAACLAASPASARIVDIETVRAMAFDKGIVEIEMKVDARTGQIIKLERN